MTQVILQFKITDISPLYHILTLLYFSYFLAVHVFISHNMLRSEQIIAPIQATLRKSHTQC